MKKLSIAIPEWNIKRSAKVYLEKQLATGKEHLRVEGIDTNNRSYDFLKACSINKQNGSNIVLKATEQKENSVYKLNLGFQGWYKEPSLELDIPRSLLIDNKDAIKVDMIYNPRTLKWEFVMSYDFHNKNDLDIISFKNSIKGANDLAKAMDKKLKL